MAQKETYKTMKRFCLVNYCTTIVILSLHLSSILAIETDGEIKQNITLMENDTSQQPVAEPLVLYRRQPPRTIIKQIIRPKRFKTERVKRPKIKYSFAEPPPTYYVRKPVTMKKPTFESSILKDFSHLNMESSNFNLPPSSYEAQSMDLDLYSQHEPANTASYKDIQKPSPYSHDVPEIVYKDELSSKEPSKPTATYSHTPSKKSPRKPHTKYGVPTEHIYSNGNDKPTNTNKYLSKPVYTEIEKPSYNVHSEHEYSSNKASTEAHQIPATKYTAPDYYKPLSASNDHNKYTVTEQKSAYANFIPVKTEINNRNNAEHPRSDSGIEITYSPFYEINIPSSHESTYSKKKYNVQYHAHPSNKANSEQQHHPPNVDQLSNKYKRPSKQNYEHPPASYQESSDINQTELSKHASIDKYIPTSQDLPISVNHNQPPYDYPKSSYEVPIYNSMTFDSSNNPEQEFYPPQIYHHSIRHPGIFTSEFPAQHNNVHSPETPQFSLQKHRPIQIRLHGTRERQRTEEFPFTSLMNKHILDVPELREAFEKENDNKFSNLKELREHESHKIENFDNRPWSPSKIINPYISMATTPSSISSNSTSRIHNKRYNNQQRNTTTYTTEKSPLKLEIISGVLSTPKIYDANYSRNRYRLENPTTATPQMQPSYKIKFSKRTTKNIFDTTIFKSPLNDREDGHRNLPKNHKYI